MKGRKLVWAWGAVGFLILLLVGVLTTGIIAKVSADLEARDTTAELKSYINDVVTAAQTSNDPVKIVSAVRTVEAPEFKAIPLGDISGEYVAARARHEAAMAKVDEFITSMDGYAQTLAFYGKYETLRTQLTTLEATNTEPGGKTRDMEYLEANYALLQDINDLIEKTKVSSDYADEFVELGRVYDSMELNIEAVSFSLKLGNEAAYTNMYDVYSIAHSQVSRVETGLGTFINSLPDKIHAAREDLKIYGEKL